MIKLAILYGLFFSMTAQAVDSRLLNADVRQTTINQTICQAGYTKTVRPSTTFTNGIKKRLMTKEGKDFDADKGSYELDHIIPLALGGHPRNPRNLMLQAWEGSDGAKRKDRLEVKLQCLVCAGDLTLEGAQDAIWADWRAAYATYGRMVCHRPRGLKSGSYGDS